jgi:hypothetical protein
LEHPYTVGLRRLAVRAGTNGSFEEASKDLKEYCGLTIAPTTISELCQREAPKMQAWRQTSSTIQQDFIEAQGDSELGIDGTCVNTKDGWREVKTVLISKRKRGKGVKPKQWEDRALPKVQSCVAFAAVEKSDRFQKRFRHWRRQLRLGSTGDISVLADGAKWIWNAVRSEFGKVRECLDIYHALEHLSATGKVLYGERTQEYERWREETKWELLESGFERIEKRIAGLLGEKRTKRERKSLEKLRGYLSSHSERLCYCERLSEGRAIGSGQVEGACKNMIGRRLKQTGAQWKVRRLNRMTILCAVRYCDQWNEYWIQAK